MKKWRNYLLVALCLAVLLGVSAAKVEAAATSGTYGDLNWEFNETTGTLTVSGQGEMPDLQEPPWWKLCKKCTRVVVEEGVTALGKNAFYEFEKLTEVSLPSTLTKIGLSAFNDCVSLPQIQIPDSVTYIGYMSFSGCKSLTEMVIPEGVQEINCYAFSGCVNLTRLQLPDTLHTIGMGAFRECESLTTVTIPDSVTKIGTSLFSHCISLTSVTLSKNLEDLGSNVFMDCISLKSIVIPDKVVRLDHYAFYRCISLTDVTIGAGVQTIHRNAFRECYNLEKLQISSENKYLFADGGVVYKKNMEELVLAVPGISGSYTVLPGTQNIGRESFYQCIFLTEVILPDSVIRIKANAFERCVSLKSAKLGDEMEYILDSAFANTALTSVALPASLKTLKGFAFSYCYELKEIVFLGKKPTIEENCFLNDTATAYHPVGDSSWTDLTGYGGTLTWKEINCNGKHTVVTQPAKAATCHANGLTEGSYCSYCGQVLQQQTTIPASHNYGNWATAQAPTAQKEGKSQRICSRCGHSEEKAIPKLPEEPTEPDLTPPLQTEPEEQTTEPSQSEQTQVPTQPALEKEQRKGGGAPWVVTAVVIGILAMDGVLAGVIWLKKRKK